MSIKKEIKNFTALIFFVFLVIVAAKIFGFFESKFSRQINPEAIVVVDKIQTEVLGYDLNEIKDDKKLKIIKSVINIFAEEEQLTFKGVYKRIKKLNYYNLPPLYWDQIDENQKIRSYEVWENHMNYLMSQCWGNEIIKLSKEETERCIKLKKRQIEETRKRLFE